jgi:DNA (cytosine-5)-methyltransferase 1
MTRKRSFVTVSDQFCGAGGSSQGAAQLGLEVTYAWNHDQLAIETHNTNFPNTKHDIADMRDVDPRRYDSTDILITSPECRYHAQAKGLKKPSKQMSLLNDEAIDPQGERSRSTMKDVPRFAEHHQYNVIVVENVVEVVNWIGWDSWLRKMHNYGYEHHIVYFNSMFAHLDPTAVTEKHHFAPQSRDRIYVVFWRKRNKKPDLDFRPKAHCDKCDRVVEAVQVWKRTKAVKEKGGRWGRYGKQYFYACPYCSGRKAHEVTPYYFAALNAIDFSLPITRIGDKHPPLKPKTLARVRQGWEKFGNQCLLMETAYTHAKNNRSRPISDASFTQSAQQTQGLVMPPAFMVELRNGQDSRGIDKPLSTIATSGAHHGVVVPAPFMAIFRRNHGARGIDEPLDTIVAGGNHHGLVLPGAFLASYYGTDNQRGVEEAMGSVTAVDRHALVMPFLLGYANGDGPAKTAVEPLRTIRTENGQSLVMPRAGVPIEDFYFRILQPKEVGEAMAFPKSYVVLGTKRQQVRQYGNAVTPPVMKMILERCLETLR